MSRGSVPRPSNSNLSEDDVVDEEEHYDRLKAFVLEWDIDSSNVVDFMRLVPEHREDFMISFSPENAEDSTEEINVAFHKAVWQVLQGGASVPSPSDEPSDPIQQFASEWGLNRNAMARLSMMAPEDLDETMNNFAPPPGTRDVNSKLIAFARKVTRSREKLRAEEQLDEHADVSDPLARFVLKWKLNERAVETLRELSEEMLEQTMKNFAPPSGTRDTSAKLMFYVKRFILPKHRTHDVPAEEFNADVNDEDDDLSDPFERFAKKWGINAEAMEQLRDLPEDVATETMAAFSPPVGAKDRSGTLVKFIAKQTRKVETPRKADHDARDIDPDDPFEQFVQKFGLNEDSVERLHNLPPDLLDEALETFNPPAGTRDMNAKLEYFISNFIQPAQQENLRDFKISQSTGS
jgi:hypothetical protein